MIEIQAGVLDSSELASLYDDTMCIWNYEARGYTVESDPILMTRLATFIFEDRVSQNCSCRTRNPTFIAFGFQGNGPLRRPEIAEEGPNLFGQ